MLWSVRTNAADCLQSVSTCFLIHLLRKYVYDAVRKYEPRKDIDLSRLQFIQPILSLPNELRKNSPPSSIAAVHRRNGLSAVYLPESSEPLEISAHPQIIEPPLFYWICSPERAEREMLRQAWPSRPPHNANFPFRRQGPHFPEGRVRPRKLCRADLSIAPIQPRSANE